MTVPSSLTPAEIDNLKHVFSSYTDGKTLTANDLAEIYRKAKISISREEIEEQVRAADTKGHGRIDFDDFLTQYQHNPEAGLAAVFAVIDKDKDGLISGEDLKNGISEFGESLSDEEIREMVTAADVDGDGLVNFEEFVKILTPSKVNGQ